MRKLSNWNNFIHWIASESRKQSVYKPKAGAGMICLNRLCFLVIEHKAVSQCCPGLQILIMLPKIVKTTDSSFNNDKKLKF